MPISKADVFNLPGSVMSLLEKRALMKFLQFVMDVRTEKVEGTPVGALNEKALGAGRSLLRWVRAACVHAKGARASRLDGDIKCSHLHAAGKNLMIRAD